MKDFKTFKLSKSDVKAYVASGMLILMWAVILAFFAGIGIEALHATTQAQKICNDACGYLGYTSSQLTENRCYCGSSGWLLEITPNGAGVCRR